MSLLKYLHYFPMFWISSSTIGLIFLATWPNELLHSSTPRTKFTVLLLVSKQSLESVTGSLFIFISKLNVIQSASTSFPTVNSMRTTICAMKKCTKHGCNGGAGKLANSAVSSLVFDSIQTAANNLNENILEMAMHLWTSQSLYFKTGAGAKSLVGKFSFFRMCVFALERFCR